MLMKHRWFLYRLLSPLAVIALFVTAFIGPGFVGRVAAQSRAVQAPAPPPPSALSPDGDPLLLVHGFTDTCDYAFNHTDVVPNTGLNARRTIEYLENNGWDASALDLIGYYDPLTPHDDLLYNGQTVPTIDGTTGQSAYDPNTGLYAWGSCTHNLQEFIYQNQTEATLCDPYREGYQAGSFNDPLEHLGCLLAWYIYDTYQGRPVDILAHSMGGLIVRDAIGESGHNIDFPPSPLNVHIVVTVGTPHGGVYGTYLYLALQIDGSVRELLDMVPGSAFMNLLSQPAMEPPQGLYGTSWNLMASSVPCGLSGTAAVSCAVEYFGINGPYPDGDGVVQADSALAMPANVKILYGAGCVYNVACGSQGSVSFDGGGLRYSHEANTCLSGPITIPIPINGVTLTYTLKAACLAQPFYLNDGTSSSTQGWECNFACDLGSPGLGHGGMSDMGVINSAGQGTSGQAVPDSLAEIAHLLSSQGPGTPPGIPNGPAVVPPLGWVGVTWDGLLQPFVVGAGQQLWTRQQHCALDQCWLPWSSLGSLQMVGYPAVARSVDGRQAVFARGTDGVLYTAWQSCPSFGCAWSSWAAMESGVVGDPAVALSSQGQMEVFAVRSDGNLWSAWQVCAGCGWSSWVSFGGSQNGKPVVGTPTVWLSDDGRFQAFVRLSDGTLETSWQTCPGCGWTGWATYTTNTLSDPTLTMNVHGGLEVFVERQDGTLWHAWQSCIGCGWSAWVSLGGPQMVGKPAVVKSPDGRLEVFVRGTDQGLWTAWQSSPGSSNWSGWIKIATTILADPGANLNSDGRLEVFAMGLNGVLWYVSQPCVSCAWSSPVSLGASGSHPQG